MSVEILQTELRNRKALAAHDRKRAGLLQDQSTMKAPTGHNEKAWLLHEAAHQDLMVARVEQALGKEDGTLF